MRVRGFLRTGAVAGFGFSGFSMLRLASRNLLRGCTREEGGRRWPAVAPLVSCRLPCEAVALSPVRKRAS